MRHKSIGFAVLVAGLLLLVTPLRSLAVNSDVLTVYPNRADGMNPSIASPNLQMRPPLKI